MTSPSILDTLIYGYRKIFAAGSEVTNRSQLNFKTGFTVADNPETGSTDVSADATTTTFADYSTRISADIDFTALPDQTISSDGNVTIGGLTWTMENYAKATSVQVVNGTGLRITCNTSNGDYVYGTTRSAALIHAKLSDILPGWQLHQMKRTRLWVYLSHNADANYEYAKFGFEGNATPTLTQAIAGIGYNSALNWGFLQNDANNTTDSVGIIDWYDPLRFTCRSGVYSSGWPDIESTNEHFSGDAMLSGTAASVKAGWKNTANVDFTFIAQTANTSGNFVATLKRLRVETW